VTPAGRFELVFSDSLAVLLPTVPAQDMLDLLSSLGIACVHRLPGDTFSEA